MNDTGRIKAILSFLIPISAFALIVFLIIFGMRKSGQQQLSEPDQITKEAEKPEDISMPCKVTFNYRPGTIDSKFDIDKFALMRAVNDATKLWAGAVDSFALQYDRPGSIPINLVYDDRQRSLDNAVVLENRLKQYEGYIEEQTKEFERLKQRHKQAEADYDEFTARYNAKLDQFNNWVESTNLAGSWTETRTEKYERDKEILDNNEQHISILLNQVNDYVDRINGIQNRINDNIRIQNQLVSQLNEMAENKQLFEAGIYDCRSRLNCHITIYAFEGHNELVLLLAHEIGHALGVGHVSDSTSLMYASTNESHKVDDFQLSKDDILAIREVCR